MKIPCFCLSLIGAVSFGTFPMQASFIPEEQENYERNLQSTISRVYNIDYDISSQGPRPQSAGEKRNVQKTLKNDVTKDVKEKLLESIEANKEALKATLNQEAPQPQSFEEKVGAPSAAITSSSSQGSESEIEGVFHLGKPVSKQPIVCPNCNSTIEEKTDMLWNVRNTSKKYATILALDGGGIRGYMQALWLDYLERKTNIKSWELFDGIGGTSIGGIVALGVTMPKEAGSKELELSSEDLINLFTKEGDRIFPQRYRYNYVGKLYDNAVNVKYALYDATPLEKLLQSKFKEKTFQQTLTRVSIVSANAVNQKPFIFDSQDKDLADTKVWEIGRSTSAAPTFFKSYTPSGRNLAEERFVDGGLYRNNPAGIIATDMYESAREQGEVLLPDNMIMLSLGTGKMPLQHILPSDVGLLQAAKPVIETIMNACSVGTHQLMKSILPTDNYTRINPRLYKNIALDKVSDSNFNALKEAAEAMYDKIDDFIEESPFRLIVEGGGKNTLFFEK